MPRGGARNVKPAAVHVVEGTFRPERHAQQRRKPSPGLPVMPRGLLPAAQAEWRRVVAELARLGLLSRLDGPVLSVYVTCWARWRQLQTDLDNGADWRTRVAAERAGNSLRLLANELGLTPAARARLPVPEPSQDGPIPGGVR